MAEDIIQELWDKGKPQEGRLSVMEIEQALRPHARRQSHVLRMNIWIWIVILAGTLAFDALNIPGYWVNPVMLAVQIGLTLLAALFGIYGIHLLREVRIIDRADESMMATLKRMLRFYRTKFEIWNFMMAATLVLLTFAVCSYVDNDNGHYRINQVTLFVTVSAFQFAFMYGVNKIAQHPFRKEMKIIMADLEANVVEGTKTLGALRKRWRMWATVFTIIGTILLLYGIWRAIQMTR